MPLKRWLQQLGALLKRLFELVKARMLRMAISEEQVEKAVAGALSLHYALHTQTPTSYQVPPPDGEQ